MSRMLKSMTNIPHRRCHSRAKYAHRYVPSKLVLLYRSLELKWREWLRECTIQSWSSVDGSLIIRTAFIARKTYKALTEANSVKTIPARHYFVLADPFSGPDKVILFFFPVLIITKTERHLSASPGSTSRHNWNIAFFFVWSSSLPFWKDLDYWVAHQSKWL